MSSATRYSNLTDAQLRFVHDICDRFESDLRAERSVSLSAELEAAPEELRRVLFRELLDIELEIRSQSDEAPKAGEYHDQFPDWHNEIVHAFSQHDTAPDETTELSHIGRYQVQERLGSGGFANVYLAYDDQLHRKVAIKVPHRQKLSRRDEVRRYLDEAQTLANLDHPHIVPVHDIGRDERFPCYIVSKYIEGMDLSKRLKQGLPSWRESASLVAEIADALHHAHKRGLVHRDVKPGNILLDQDNQAFLADFGVALREDDCPGASQLVGTPAYMSPEQAKGEGHRVDGRSDVYSLGAVFYEMLTGQRTFPAKSRLESISRIASDEPKPPRQISDAIPKELERICLKALSRRVRERYSTALDLAEELRDFLVQSENSSLTPHAVSDSRVSTRPSNHDSTSLPTDSQYSRTPHPTESFSDRSSLSDSDRVATQSNSRSGSSWVIPRGLRSFAEEDHEFYLSLIPGPFDRTGLPASVQFWKARIEERDADQTFPVGVIFGPSGCGKSSLVRAGIIPRLSNDVACVRVEASSAQTESRLKKALRKHFPELPAEMSLPETFARIRNAQIAPHARKLVIIVDQFEQWLHANQGQSDLELTSALRQCDGSRVQCLLLIRDDFWLALSRFMQDLELELVTGHNLALVDLFDKQHAARVLIAFGRAYGRLAGKTSEMEADQSAFIRQAIDGLADQDKVICIRIALFAEMMKAKTWAPSSLKDVGGIEGVGVTFLEETFSSQTANPTHRLHQRAARAVLSSLLPESSLNIKGLMKSEEELRKYSSYASRTRDFEALIKILDGELRLITPADPAGMDGADESPLPETTLSNPGTQDSEANSQEGYSADRSFYQLTHDYLVPSIRTWLTRKRKETRRGRAELRLADCTSSWKGRRENRHLPSLFEWVAIRSFTKPKEWTKPERKMMQTADKLHGTRWVLGLAAAVLVVIALQQINASVQHRNLVGRMNTTIDAMANARGPLVQSAIEDLDEYPRDLVVDELIRRYETANDDRKLALAYALANYGEPDIPFLVSSINTSAPIEVNNLATSIRQSGEQGLKALKESADQHTQEDNWRLKHRTAVVGLYAGEASIAAEMCELSPVRIQRLEYIKHWSSWHGDVRLIANQLEQQSDPVLISGTCCGLGQISPYALSVDAKKSWTPLVNEWYQTSPNANVHASAEFLLKQWELDAVDIAEAQSPNAQREWEINSVGMTMVTVPAGQFQRKFGHNSRTPGTGPFLDAPVTTVKLTQDILMSDKEVSYRQFAQMLDDVDYNEADKPLNYEFDQALTPTPDHPVQRCNWNDAVKYCNWLSIREGLQPCYARTGHVWQIPTGQFEEWKLDPDANGYRLPTESEYEYACRAGIASQNPMGDALHALIIQIYSAGRTRITSIYGREHRVEPCGSVAPNGWGIYDLHGNALEWCNDWWTLYWTIEEGDASIQIDPIGPEKNTGRLERVVRDGIFFRQGLVFTLNYNYYGFRVVRTIQD